MIETCSKEVNKYSVCPFCMVIISYLNSLVEKKVTLKLRHILYVANLGKQVGCQRTTAACPEASE